MHQALNLNLFFVREHVRIFKAANAYDIIDPQTNQQVLFCQEEKLGFFTKLFRFTDYKRMTPFNIEVKTPQNETLITVRRGVTWFRSHVDVLNGDDVKIGQFKQRLFSIGGKFEVQDPEGRILCMLKGTWTSWNFKFVSADGKEFASVTKKWSGIGKELFTTADNYILTISDDVPANHPLRELIIAAVMCIDLVLKE